MSFMDADHQNPLLKVLSYTLMAYFLMGKYISLFFSLSVLISLELYLMLGETSADGSGFLGTQIEGQVLLVLVDFPQSSLLFL
ncbi:hypothetical protein RHGRI_007559 [Rhododendron griersonianum]|uniref:Uncharacterized protein n=1 Tax=Rhododendron griersonianum TaxID=479676 RepID=A0AAV6KYV4_9ERIC|nr:hypothetical protein RHGRI_007559 [Rhododendron griersonianum]